MKFLREFNHGRASHSDKGSTIREFTIIASDQGTKEISPGVNYNVWTFNNTVPGPTLRATEGDLIRINFVNNGSGFHTMHFHGIHPSEMDGDFEGIEHHLHHETLKKLEDFMTAMKDKWSPNKD